MTGNEELAPDTRHPAPAPKDPRFGEWAGLPGQPLPPPLPPEGKPSYKDAAKRMAYARSFRRQTGRTPSPNADIPGEVREAVTQQWNDAGRDPKQVAWKNSKHSGKGKRVRRQSLRKDIPLEGREYQKLELVKDLPIKALQDQAPRRLGKQSVEEQRGTIAYAASKLPGGRREFMEYAAIAAHKDERYKGVIKLWNLLTPSRRGESTIDDLCERNAVDPGEFLGAVICELKHRMRDVSEVVAATAEPHVIEKISKFALKEKNWRDREMLTTITGILPQKQGSRVNVFQNATVNTERVDGEPGLPAFEAEVIASDQNVRKQLTAAVTVPPESDGEAE